MLESKKEIFLSLKKLTFFEKQLIGNTAIKGYSSDSQRILKHKYYIFAKEFYLKIERAK